MSPIRRYLRITKYSVIECRIFLENPSLAESWLLNPRLDVLSRVMKKVFPLILPKLYEENDRSKGKNNKKRGIKDFVIEDDFEVSIFLTDTRTRHCLLTKQKRFYDKNKKGLISNSNKLLGAADDPAIAVPHDIVIREEQSDRVGHCMSDIPLANDPSQEGPLHCSNEVELRDSELDRHIDSNISPTADNHAIHPKNPFIIDEDTEEKKMAICTTYEGFSVHGRVLCLVVKCLKSGDKCLSGLSGPASMENWISSTQIPAQEIL